MSKFFTAVFGFFNIGCLRYFYGTLIGCRLVHWKFVVSGVKVNLLAVVELIKDKI